MSDYTVNMNLKGWISANALPDVTSLQDEIAKLREENAFLQSENKRLEDLAISVAKKGGATNDEDDLLKVLRAIKIKIPAKLTGGGDDTELDLFTLCYNNRDVLVTGVTDAMNASEVEQFYFSVIMPKLQAHGLAQNDKVPGVRYRRACLNRKGQSFFAEFEKKVLLSKDAEPKSKPKSDASTKKITVIAEGAPSVDSHKVKD